MTNLNIEKPKYKSLLIFKILFIVAYALMTAFLVWNLIDSLTSENVGLSLALYLALIVIIIGSIGYIVCIILAIVGLIISIVKKTKPNIITFVIFTLLPIITEAIIIIITTSLKP